MTKLEQILTTELVLVVLPLVGLACWAGVYFYRRRKRDMKAAINYVKTMGKSDWCLVGWFAGAVTQQMLHDAEPADDTILLITFATVTVLGVWLWFRR